MTKKSTLKSKVSKSTKSTIELRTSKLKEMVSRSVKGASFRSTFPVTSMIAIELKDNTLTLKTTDYTNYLYIREDKVAGEDFYAVVLADVFSKLVAKITSEMTTLTLKPNALEVVGNGKYLIELQQEDDGGMVQFPDPAADADLRPLKDDIQLTTISAIYNTAKSSLATTLDNPCYTGYYCGDKVLATDKYKLCCMNIKLWKEPRLISPEMVNLLTVMTAENISVSANDDQIMFSSPDCVIYGRTMEGIEDFAVNDIEEVLEMEFPSTCTLKKSQILQVLDRLSLFVTSVDHGEVNFVFTEGGLQISSKAASGTELIKYMESEDFEEFECAIDLKMLTTQIKAIAGDAVEMHYGDSSAIKLVEGNTVQVLSLQSDDDEEELEEIDDEDEELLDDEE